MRQVLLVRAKERMKNLYGIITVSKGEIVMLARKKMDDGIERIILMNSSGDIGIITSWLAPQQWYTAAVENWFSIA